MSATAAFSTSSNEMRAQEFCMLKSRPIRGIASLIVSCLVAAPMWASDKQATAPQVPANDLVREAVNKELKTNTARSERFRYRMKKVSPEGTQIKEYVETDAGTIARLVAVND